MKQLQGTLRRNPPPPHPTHFAHERTPRQRDAQKWSLDPDLVEQAGSQEEKLSWEVQELLRRKFESEKYLEEVAPSNSGNLPRTPQRTYGSSRPHALPAASAPRPRTHPARRHRVCHRRTQEYGCPYLDYLKHFQSLLDAKIRKLSNCRPTQRRRRSAPN